MSPKRKVVLALMAHPDDTEILCAGTLIRLADAGWEVHIATATRGDCGTMTESAEKISEIRSKEAQAAVAIIKGRWHTLGELDGKVVYDKPTISKTCDLFRVITPTLVFTHAPRDYMVDHEQVSLLARAVSFIFAAPNVSKIPRHPDAGVPYLYYCDPVEGIDPLGKAVKPSTYIDITEQMPRKEQMLACHGSQRDWLRAHHGMDEYIESMKSMGESRGKFSKTKYAEGFIQHRGHAFPLDNLLKNLFGKS